ncbi:CaiB/BaiF CoA-transferase family protein [Arthrobacter sp. EpRS71]|uniref:CaiB/BaiF CoA transferase family protein n=1 Tax=Arthrobacter sp. EpRS71 TaxID=1743141 RepID=UPI00074628B7|nr:CaiB/BaiF CoA-transferase family protein [Arthrobacter sp. EpRS71]KUM36703.1 carnitine dehydratase [Arthrobacter sp. EpRS71]
MQLRNSSSLSDPSSTSRPGPLHGVVVVSLEQAVAAPFATRQLADLGARVIKVERPGAGDLARGYDTTVKGLASHFVWLNRGKESVAIDVKTAEGAEILRQLVDRADVLVQNLAPGAAARLGIGADELAKTRPDLITCDISGYGSGGPYSAKKAYDLLIQCETGLVSITGTDETPSKVGLSIADVATGMYAYSGMLTALLRKEQTGQGANLEISMLEALGEWMGYPLLYTMYGGTAPARTGASHATIAPYGPFTVADGTVINLGLQNEREWENFCTVVLEQPELREDPRFSSNYRRVENRDQLDRIISSVFSELSVEEAVARLERAPIAYAEQRTMSSFATHPQLEARKRWAPVSTPAGEIQALIPPVTFDGETPSLLPVPDLGEHTEAVLQWLNTTRI